MKSEQRALRKSADDYAMRGTIGGVAEYLGWSPSRLRTAYVFLTVCSAALPGLILYIALTVVMPEPETPFRLEDLQAQ